MAFEPKYEKVTSGYRENVGKTQVVVDFKLPMTDNVNKVLCASARVFVSNAEAVDKTLNYNGFVGFQVVYKNQDGEIGGSTYTAEFRDKYEADSVLNGTTPIVNANVIDTTTTVENGDVKVSAIVELDIDVVRQNQVDALVDIKDFVTKKADFSYGSYDGMLYDKWDVVADIEIKDSVKTVLAVLPNTYIENITPNDKFVTVKGGIDVEICYVSDNNLLRSTNQTINFTQEIAGEKIIDLSDISSIINNDINENKITTTIDTDSTMLNVVLPIVYNGYVFNLNTIDVVTDAYSLTNYATFTTSSVTTYKAVDNVSWEEKISSTLQLDENTPVVDEVLGACCDSIVVANTTVLDGRVTIEGVAHTTLVYRSGDENSVNSIEIEIPFSTSSSTNSVDNVSNSAMIALINVCGKARRGRDLEVSGSLVVYVDMYDSYEEGVITSVEIGEEIPENECSMSFYFTKDGDTVWDIAKEMGVAVDDLLAQNPNLSDPIERGTRVVVYRQKIVEY